MRNHYYITTTLPYVNADPHIGFALEIVQADVIARTKRLRGYEVIFNTGTDEHGIKILRKAEEQNIDVQSYVDSYATKFHELMKILEISNDRFIRTTDPDHIVAAQEFWKRCAANGDIYKKNYHVKYCVGCEMEKTDSELTEGRCPLHPKQEIEVIEEENYFFRFSRYQEPLLKLYQDNPSFILPAFRLNEISNFIKQGLEDFSISRLKSKMPWGVPVPGDDEHVMYVWFDALVNYISTLGWPQNNDSFTRWWPGVQVAGKDNLRQQSAMWQAMLQSAQLPNSTQIIIHGFITSNGQKMSKSVGNVVNPIEVINEYGVDALRYYLLKEIPSLDDGDYSPSRMEELYNADLANELGNLVMRLTNLGAKDNLEIEKQDKDFSDSSLSDHIHNLVDQYAFNIALTDIWKEIKALNKSIDIFEPWKKSSTDRYEFLKESLGKLNQIGMLLQPFLPNSANRIIESTYGTINKCTPLFPKKKN